ncbi:MAG: hypothetical protein HUU50_19265 [Candidatus Brocadiae bacterium]|nr:hypothetical protein [Candidatus Brocadiia bacterium]
MNGLTKQHLVQLVQSVFPKLENDRVLGILVDIPQQASKDNPNWEMRRRIALDWAKGLRDSVKDLGLERVELVGYPDVGSNGAELPFKVYLMEESLPDVSSQLAKLGKEVLLKDIFSQIQIWLAPTEYSTTAPLKNAANVYGFRAATMPGFCESMIPALQLDYTEVGRRVDIITAKLDIAKSAKAIFIVDEKKKYEMVFDLRFRKGHASSGRFPKSGVAGNLPSGESYIVPYEGERKEKSQTQGVLPVQFGTEMVFYKVDENRVVSVDGEGDAFKREKDLISKEPAYANIAEVGFGVLRDFGVKPIGEVLLDEKLGFHVAFGRSDHFGGQVGPAQFSSPSAVVHIDRIYIPETQPRVHLKSLVLLYEDGNQETILSEGKYLIFSDLA